MVVALNLRMSRRIGLRSTIINRQYAKIFLCVDFICRNQLQQNANVCHLSAYLHNGVVNFWLRIYFRGPQLVLSMQITTFSIYKTKPNLQMNAKKTVCIRSKLLLFSIFFFGLFGRKVPLEMILTLILKV